jgi:phage terminase large subunit-like protein
MLLCDWQALARPEQLPPAGDWSTWFVLAGRGWGKTRCGAETVRLAVEKWGVKRIALVGRTSADVRDVMIRGESGILGVSSPDNMPVYKPSERSLSWPSGAVATTYSSEKPDQLRGPQHEFAWCDELASYRYSDTWDQLQAGLRLGRNPRSIITTTPRPTKIVKRLLAQKTTVCTGGSTLENKHNLARAFVERVLSSVGSSFSRQEFFAEVLGETEGALWTLARLEQCVVSKCPELARTVIAVDPAISSDTTKDDPGETGIVVCGLGKDGIAYVLEDLSGVYRPREWANVVDQAFVRHNADRVVCEDNQGGDLLEDNLRAVRSSLPIKRVRAVSGKKVRAEPVSALYESQLGYPQGRVRHLGHFPELETQQTTWVPSKGKSPDRVDALVWGITELLGRDKRKRGAEWTQVNQYESEVEAD